MATAAATALQASAWRTAATSPRATLLVNSTASFAPYVSGTGLTTTRNFSLWPSRKQNDAARAGTRHASSANVASTSKTPVARDENRLPHQMDKFEPGWAMSHARYTQEELDNVKVLHRAPTSTSDVVAAAMVNVMRWGFDMATRYPKHRAKFPRVAGSESSIVKLNEEGKNLQRKQAQAESAKISQDESDLGASTVASTTAPTPAKTSSDLPEEMTLGEMRRKGLSFGPEQWLMRIVFLESVAGVPGMMAAMARHLHSLRLLRRDKGWIHTLLEDAANERQHLLVAMKLYEPGVVMRGLLIGAQGVFCNFFFLLYLVAPRIAHRFVGVLEEEAVVTYSRILDDIHAGRLPEWEHLKAPAIAIDYWGLRSDATIVDVIRALRADEASHRYINHTLAEIESSDFNPFAYREASPASRGLSWGMTRDEALAHFAKEDAEARRLFDAQQKQPQDPAVPHDVKPNAKVESEPRSPKL